MIKFNAGLAAEESERINILVPVSRNQVATVFSLLAPQVLSSFIKNIDKDKVILSFTDKITRKMRGQSFPIDSNFKVTDEHIGLKLGKDLADKFNQLSFNKVFTFESYKHDVYPNLFLKENNINLRLLCFFNFCETIPDIYAQIVCYNADLVNSKEII